MSVNRSLPHDAAPLHVTGQARYIDDIPMPADCLHLAFGLSSVARGRITALDVAAVRAALSPKAVNQAVFEQVLAVATELAKESEQNEQASRNCGAPNAVRRSRGVRVPAGDGTR